MRDVRRNIEHQNIQHRREEERGEKQRKRSPFTSDFLRRSSFLARHSTVPLFLAFDVGCSDVLPQTAPPATISTTPHLQSSSLQPPASRPDLPPIHFAESKKAAPPPKISQALPSKRRKNKPAWWVHPAPARRTAQHHSPTRFVGATQAGNPIAVRPVGPAAGRGRRFTHRHGVFLWQLASANYVPGNTLNDRI